MSKSVALLSGKGGSGKTTLALSISSMLSNCGIKVLLVDCDIFTNGATYFYEDKLKELYDNKFSPTSFHEIINEGKKHNMRFISINPNYDFLPSITQVKKYLSQKKTYDTWKYEIELFVEKVSDKYDVIIFDCQAGYTDLLGDILPYVDVNLFVMEGDAISSSAIRSLFLKIGDIINGKKVYQVFNKVTQEEYDTYSKVSGGTVFTNIETVIFDWKIRKSFSISQIPDMENSSASYGEQIYKICKILFPNKNLQDKLDQYNSTITINKKVEEEFLLTKELEKIQNDHSENKESFLRLTLLFVGAICCIFFVALLTLLDLYKPSFFNSNYLIVALSFCLAFLFAIISIISLTEFRLNGKKNKKIINQKAKQLKKVQEDIAQLKLNQVQEEKKRNE